MNRDEIEKLLTDRIREIELKTWEIVDSEGVHGKSVDMMLARADEVAYLRDIVFSRQ